ncbi:acetate--CoA ligase family protein [Saxibacter everestensis]|uniref:Acetate--CoA ligase family protein n=1 Tax=Saxibacter everestensis TaxID=2909229 RepID=A0ABY8QR92_9MICO|nr:acetate--CoA ligase family protein [Brevibacteriaceae bacterium ZFBP1038]
MYPDSRAPITGAQRSGTPLGDLSAFSDPASVAIVGASENQAKWGYWLASGALTGRHRRTVHLVNRRIDSLFGQRSYPSLSQLPDVPELVALCIPSTDIADCVSEALPLGVRGFLGIASDIPNEPQLAASIRAHGARLVGANSLGIFDSSTELQLAWGQFTPGPMAIVSQSGQLGSELAVLGARSGIGVSRFVSIGNQTDVTAAELLSELAEHEPTRIIALYLESFTDGELLFETLRTLRALGKPTLLLTVGASAASSRLARSHTGSLTSALDVVDAACRAAGVLRVSTPSELIDVARSYLAAPSLAGSRIGIIADSGGQAGIAADVASAKGLAVPAFDDAVTAVLEDVLPPGASSSNPVDLAGVGERDLSNYVTVVERLLGSDQIDAALLTGYFGRYGTDNPDLAEHEVDIAKRLAAVAGAAGKPLIVHSMAADATPAETLWAGGVPCFGAVEKALAATSGLAGLNRKARTPVAMSIPDSNPALRTGYWAARELLAGIGVSFPRGFPAATEQRVAELISDIRAPFVLKAGWLEHKSEAGGVAVGIEDRVRLVELFQGMRGRLGDGEYVIEEQETSDSGVEILVGARREAGLGPIIVVGAGGTDAEVHRDVTIELAPVSADTALEMIDRLRCSALLAGWRGRPGVNTAALATLISKVSQLIAARPDIAEIELNPVLVTPHAAVAVDALIVPGGELAPDTVPVGAAARQPEYSRPAHEHNEGIMQ